MENKQLVILCYSYANKKGKVLSFTPTFANSLLISTKNEKKEICNHVCANKGLRGMWEVFHHRQNQNKKPLKVNNKLKNLSTAQKNQKTATKKQGTASSTSKTTVNA